jgi:hypothetical protein
MTEAIIIYNMLKLVTGTGILGGLITIGLSIVAGISITKQPEKLMLLLFPILLGLSAMGLGAGNEFVLMGLILTGFLFVLHLLYDTRILGARILSRGKSVGMLMVEGMMRNAERAQKKATVEFNNEKGFKMAEEARQAGVKALNQPKGFMENLESGARRYVDNSGTVQAEIQGIMTAGANVASKVAPRQVKDPTGLSGEAKRKLKTMAPDMSRFIKGAETLNKAQMRMRKRARQEIRQAWNR